MISMKRPDNLVFYGGDGTIHGSELLNVEIYKGKVVAVWFRCLRLPFDQTEVDKSRRDSMLDDSNHLPSIIGIELKDEGK